jgi:multiple sugar transport system substrate-binding protein
MKRLALVLALIVLSIMAAQCVAAPTPEQVVVTVEVEKEVIVTKEVEVEKEVVVTPTPGEKKTVVLWTRTMPPAMAEFIEDTLLPNFYAENPDVEVKWEQFPVAEFDEKIVSTVMTGAGPDVINLLDQRVFVLADAGVIAPITDEVLPLVGYNNRAQLEAEYLPAGIQYASWDGQLYGLGDELSSQSFYINEEHFKEAGLDPDSVDLSTWDKVAEVAKQLVQTDADGNIVREGFDCQITGLPAHSVVTLDTMLKQAGGSYLNEDQTQCALDTPEAKQALETLKMLLIDNETGGPNSGQPGSVGMIKDACFNASVSMWYTNPAAVQVLCQQDTSLGKDQWRAMPMPTIDGELRGATAWGWVWVVTNYSEVQPEAWKLVKALAGEPEEHMKRTGFVQPIAWLENTEFGLSSPLFEYYWPVAAVSSPPMKSLHYDELEPVIESLVDRILLEGEDIDTAVEGICTEINSILAE